MLWKREPMRSIDGDHLKRWILSRVFQTQLSVADVIDQIDREDTIEPERKKGEWIEQDDAWDGVYYECSVCKEPFTLIDGTPSENLYNFCPNCGADMRGNEHD